MGANTCLTQRRALPELPEFLLRTERRKRQRQEDGAARRRNWQEKFGEQETSNPYRDTPPYRDGAAADSAAKYKQKSGELPAGAAQKRVRSVGVNCP